MTRCKSLIQLVFLDLDSNEKIKPNENIQRADLLASLVTGLGYYPTSRDYRFNQIKGDLIHNLSALYADGVRIVGIYEDFDQSQVSGLDTTNKIAIATAFSLVVNHPDAYKLNANRNATRAEVAATLYQVLAKSDRFPHLESSYIPDFSVGSPPPWWLPLPNPVWNLYYSLRKKLRR